MKNKWYFLVALLRNTPHVKIEIACMIFLEFYNENPKSKYLDWIDENLHLKDEEVYTVCE